MTNRQFDFDSNFVSVDSQEKGAEFEIVNDAGDKTGWFIRLAGPDSTRRKKTKARLQDFYFKHGVASNASPRNRKERRAAKQVESYTGDTAKAFNDLMMDDMVAATISWRFPEGFAGPECTPDTVREQYEKYSTIYEQVAEAADDLDRFTKS